jgi:hypothetical protein
LIFNQTSQTISQPIKASRNQPTAIRSQMSDEFQMSLHVFLPHFSFCQKSTKNHFSTTTNQPKPLN